MARDRTFGELGCVVNLISVPATSRYDSVSRAGLSSKLIYEMNQYGDAVIVGGGNLYENGELELRVQMLGVSGEQSVRKKSKQQRSQAIADKRPRGDQNLRTRHKINPL